MHNDFFRFKQFVIHHGQCAMKVGTDGVLLGAWAGAENLEQVLDVGTGSGLIAIMLAQRTNASIDAVEIDSQACIQAGENVSACPWSDRITIYQDSFQNFSRITGKKYDLIISNPPFHKESIKPEHPGRRIARHSDTLDYKTIIALTPKLLLPEGKLSLILPSADFEDVVHQAEPLQLACTRITHVIPAPGKPPARVLLEFSFRPTGCSENFITIEKDMRNQYTQEYMDLTREFYLKF